MGRMKRWVSIFLAALMLFPLMPPLDNDVHAAVNLQIQNWRTSATQPVDPSNVTTQYVDIEVDFTQIQDDDLGLLYYEIESIRPDGENLKVEVTDNTPDKTGTQRVVFRDVELYEGLNKITVIHDSGSMPRSLPAWINFTAVATISNLTVDGETFGDGAFLPETNPNAGQTSIFIDGIAPNATDVTGHTTLSPQGNSASFFFPATGQFSFTAGEDNNIDLPLRPGDNLLSIIASNALKTYRAEREFTYNNGQAFLFNTSVEEGNNQLNPPNYEMLFKEPTFSAADTAGPYVIDMETDVKINRVADGLNYNLEHSGFKLEINNSSVTYDVYFNNLNENAGTIDYTSGALNGTVDLEVNSDHYIIKDIPIEGIGLDLTKSTQMLNVSFIPRPGYETDEQDFTFYYVNENDPYVSSVKFKDTEVNLFSGIEVSISLDKIELLVDTYNNPDGVRVYMPDQSSAAVTTGQQKANEIPDLTANATVAGANGSVALSWTAPTTPDADFDHYEVFQATGDGALRSNGAQVYSGGSNTPPAFTGLTPGETYSFAVYMVDDDDNYDAARTITVKVENGKIETKQYFSVTLDKTILPEGRSTLRFVPYSGATEYIGVKEYMINYNPSPYVYVSNIHSGQIFNEATGMPRGINPSNGNPFNGPVFQIRPVNIPSDQWGDIRVILNDNYDKIRTTAAEFPAGYQSNYGISSDLYPDQSTSNFQEFHFYFANEANSTTAHVNRRGWTLNNGLNILRLEVYPAGTLDNNADPGNVEPITTFEYELFYYRDDLPIVASLAPEREFLKDHTYQTLEEFPNRYYTQETRLQFQTTVLNASEVDIVFNHYNEDGESIVSRATLEWDSANKVFVEDSDPNNIIAQRVTDNTIGYTAATDTGSAHITSQLLDLHGTGTSTVEVTATNSSGIFSTQMIEIVREPASFVVHYPLIDPVSKIGTINGNFTRLYIEAEGADKIIYGKDEEVSQTTEVSIDGQDRDLFVFEVKGLKKGDNDIEFTIVRGTQEEEAEITLVNANTVVPGAEFKESIERRKIKAFEGALELEFPKGTVLRKNDPTAPNQALSPYRDIFVGIADPIDGRVNKILHPAFSEDVSKFEKKSEWNSRYQLLREPTGRYRAVSNMYWIDGGMVSDSVTEVLTGSGSYPYERDKEFYTRRYDNLEDQFVPSQTGELTLQYDPNIVSSAWRYVTVFHYGYNEDHQGNRRFEWKNIGGTVDSRKNTITVPISEFGYYMVMYMDQSFDDITGHGWARNFMDTLYAKGIMKPKSTNRFETNEKITRGEFTTLITKAYDIPLNYDGNRSTFSDVRKVDPLSFGLYEYKYIETAARAGIVRGTLGNRFMPANTITREQAASIIARAANLKLDTNDTKINAALEKQFTDVANMEDYAKASIQAVVKAGIMSGKPNVTSQGAKPTFYFDPKADMTRAEASAIIMQVLLEAKKIPSL